MDKENKQKIIEMYAKRRPIKQISKATGMNGKKIQEFLKENNLWNGHKYMLKYFNEFFFDKIDTEEKAYWLGFIYADGYLTKPTTIGIELKESDKKHLEKFKQNLEAEHEVKIYHKNSTFGPQVSCRFNVASKHMFNILLSYYKSVHKTFEGQFPHLPEEELKWACIRGFFDGDGSLSRKPSRDDLLFHPSLTFIGTKETLTYIEQESGFPWSWSQRFPERKTNNYQISLGRVHDSLNFLSKIYSNASIYLDRKYQLYQDLLKTESVIKRKQEYKASSD